MSGRRRDAKKEDGNWLLISTSEDCGMDCGGEAYAVERFISEAGARDEAHRRITRGIAREVIVAEAVAVYKPLQVVEVKIEEKREKIETAPTVAAPFPKSWGSD